MLIADIRSDYQLDQLDEQNMFSDPLLQFSKWLSQAIDFPVAEPTAMCLSTVNEQSSPSSRIVLLKNIDQGLCFFTHFLSRKGREIEHNPMACINFFWQPLERQVRVEGCLKKVSDEKSQEYFNSRPLGSRLSAIISPQSQPITSRSVLESALLDLEQDYHNKKNTEPSKPKDWGGYCLVPKYWEFWQGRPNRLHDRITYTLADQVWQRQRLAP